MFSEEHGINHLSHMTGQVFCFYKSCKFDPAPTAYEAVALPWANDIP